MKFYACPSSKIERYLRQADKEIYDNHNNNHFPMQINYKSLNGHQWLLRQQYMTHTIRSV